MTTCMIKYGYVGWLHTKKIFTEVYQMKPMYNTYSPLSLNIVATPDLFYKKIDMILANP